MPADRVRSPQISEALIRAKSLLDQADTSRVKGTLSRTELERMARRFPEFSAEADVLYDVFEAMVGQSGATSISIADAKTQLDLAKTRLLEANHDGDQFVDSVEADRARGKLVDGLFAFAMQQGLPLKAMRKEKTRLADDLLRLQGVVGVGLSNLGKGYQLHVTVDSRMAAFRVGRLMEQMAPGTPYEVAPGAPVQPRQ